MRIDTAVASALVASLIGTAACSPSEDDYAAALERHWPAEQRAQQGRANFFADHADSFERSAERSADIARRLGTDNALSEKASLTARSARWQQKEAEYIAAGRRRIRAGTQYQLRASEPAAGRKLRGDRHDPGDERQGA